MPRIGMRLGTLRLMRRLNLYPFLPTQGKWRNNVLGRGFGTTIDGPSRIARLAALAA